MTTVTIELPDELIEMFDEVRGEQDIATYLTALGKRDARRKLARRPSPPSADDLTPADHIRMATKAEANAIDFDEFERLVWQDIAQQRAKRAASIELN